MISQMKAKTNSKLVPTENLNPAFVRPCHPTRSQMFAVRLGKVRMLNEIRRSQSATVNDDPQLQDPVVPGTLGWPQELSMGSGGAALVAVMESADLRHRHDRPDCGRLKNLCPCHLP